MTISVVLQGIVGEPLTPSHTLFDEKFYRMMMDVPRLAGNIDTLPVTVSERLLRMTPVSVGDKVVVRGQVRSYNRLEEGKNRLILTAFARYLGSGRIRHRQSQRGHAGRIPFAACPITGPRPSAGRSPTCS
jgi:hypothetical protein